MCECQRELKLDEFILDFFFNPKYFLRSTFSNINEYCTYAMSSIWSTLWAERCICESSADTPQPGRRSRNPGHILPQTSLAYTVQYNYNDRII